MYVKETLHLQNHFSDSWSWSKLNQPSIITYAHHFLFCQPHHTHPLPALQISDLEAENVKVLIFYTSKTDCMLDTGMKRNKMAKHLLLAAFSWPASLALTCLENWKQEKSYKRHSIELSKS